MKLSHTAGLFRIEPTTVLIYITETDRDPMIVISFIEIFK